MEERQKTLLIYGNILTTIMTIVVNMLAVLLPLNGKTTQELSDSYPNLFVPAGYVFSIWSVIYLLMIIFVVYQALPSQKGKDYHKRIGWLFVLSNIVNIVWLFLWQYEYLIFSVVLMFILLATLVAIYLRLDIGKSKVELGEKLATNLPFSTYFGWITIASIANVATTLVSLDWDGFGLDPETWALLIIIIALFAG